MIRDLANEEHTLKIIRQSMPKGLTRIEIRQQRLPGSLSAIWQLIHDHKIIKNNSGRYILIVSQPMYRILSIADLQKMATHV